ncbi:MAG: fibronectin type III domain-containing protein [Candidatus Sumerlaeia bacterium]|nr:fibronectin type III domain-containing protein [Candidatus Sumerlaeia bacterium]
MAVNSYPVSSDNKVGFVINFNRAPVGFNNVEFLDITTTGDLTHGEVRMDAVSPTKFLVGVRDVVGNGTISLRVPEGVVREENLGPLNVETPDPPVLTIDQTPPTLVAITNLGPEITKEQEVRLQVEFSEPVFEFNGLTLNSPRELAANAQYIREVVSGGRLNDGRSTLHQAGAGEFSHYYFDVIEGAASMEVEIAANANAVLYIRHGEEASASEHDHQVSVNDSLTLNNPDGGRWHLAVHTVESAEFVIKASQLVDISFGLRNFPLLQEQEWYAPFAGFGQNPVSHYNVLLHPGTVLAEFSQWNITGPLTTTWWAGLFHRQPFNIETGVQVAGAVDFRQGSVNLPDPGRWFLALHHAMNDGRLQLRSYGIPGYQARSLYDVRVPVEGNGRLTVALPPRAVVDVAGNPVVTSEMTKSILVDQTPPTATIASAGGAFQETPTLNVNVSFSEQVFGLSMEDFEWNITDTEHGSPELSLRKNNGAIHHGTPVTFTVAPNAYRRYTFEVQPGTQQLRLSAIGSGEYDLLTSFGVEPTVAASSFNIRSVDGSAQVVIPSPAAGTWHVALHGVTQTEYTVNASAVGGNYTPNFSGSNFRITFRETLGDGNLAISLPANSVVDRAGNQNPGTAVTAIEIRQPDIWPPEVVSINLITDAVTRSASSTWRVVFNEEVIDFPNKTGIIPIREGLSQGSISITRVSGNTFDITLTNFNGTGTLGLRLAEGATADLAGNLSLPFESPNSVTYDRVAPSITLALAALESSQTPNAFVLRANFSKPVTGLNNIDSVRRGVLQGDAQIGTISFADRKTDGFLNYGIDMVGQLEKDGLVRYQLQIPAESTKVELKTSGTGSFQMYAARAPKVPTSTDFDFRSNAIGSNQKITLDSPAAGTLNIALYADPTSTSTAASFFRLLATHEGDVAPIEHSRTSMEIHVSNSEGKGVAFFSLTPMVVSDHVGNLNTHNSNTVQVQIDGRVPEMNIVPITTSPTMDETIVFEVRPFKRGSQLDLSKLVLLPTGVTVNGEARMEYGHSSVADRPWIFVDGVSGVGALAIGFEAGAYIDDEGRPSIPAVSRRVQRRVGQPLTVAGMTLNGEFTDLGNGNYDFLPGVIINDVLLLDTAVQVRGNTISGNGQLIGYDLRLDHRKSMVFSIAELRERTTRSFPLDNGPFTINAETGAVTVERTEPIPLYFGGFDIGIFDYRVIPSESYLSLDFDIPKPDKPSMQIKGLEFSESTINTSRATYLMGVNEAPALGGTPFEFSISDIKVYTQLFEGESRSQDHIDLRGLNSRTTTNGEQTDINIPMWRLNPTDRIYSWEGVSVNGKPMGQMSYPPSLLNRGVNPVDYGLHFPELRVPFQTGPHFSDAVFLDVRLDYQRNMTTSRLYLEPRVNIGRVFWFENDITLVGTVLSLGDKVFRPPFGAPILLEGAFLNFVPTSTMATGLHFPRQTLDIQGVEYITNSGFQMSTFGRVDIPGADLVIDHPLNFPFGGISFSGGEYDFYGVTTLALMNFNFQSRPYNGEHPVTGVPEEGIQLIGQLQLPNILDSFEVNVGIIVVGDEIRIDNLQFGNACDDSLDIIANTRMMVLDKLKISVPQYCFTMDYGPPTEIEVSGEFEVRGLATFGMEMSIVDMMVDRLYGYIDGIEKPLGTSGAFLQKAGLFIENIAGAVKFATEGEFCRMAFDLQGTTYEICRVSPIAFGGLVEISAGKKKIPPLDAYLAWMDAQATLSLTGIDVEGRGFITFLQIGSAIIRARWSGPERGVFAEGNIEAFSVISGNVNARFSEWGVSGCSSLGMRVPSWVPIFGGKTAGGVSFCAWYPPFKIRGCKNFLGLGNICLSIDGRGNVSTKELAGGRESWESTVWDPVPVTESGELVKGFHPEKINSGPVVRFFTNWSPVSKSYRAEGLVKSDAAGGLFEVVIPDDLFGRTGIIRLNYEFDGANPTYALITPDGERIDPESYAFETNPERFVYIENPGARDASFGIEFLVPGVYLLDIEEPDTLGDFVVQVIVRDIDPSFEFVDVAVSDSAIGFEYVAEPNGNDDAMVSFFLGSAYGATDGIGAATFIPITGTTTMAFTDLSEFPIPAGWYWPFASVETEDVQRIVHFDRPVYVPDPAAAPSVRNVQVATFGTEALITWEADTFEGEDILQHFRISYTDEPDSVNYKWSVPVTDATQRSMIIGGLELNKSYRFTVISSQGRIVPEEERAEKLRLMTDLAKLYEGLSKQEIERDIEKMVQEITPLKMTGYKRHDIESLGEQAKHLVRANRLRTNPSKSLDAAFSKRHTKKEGIFLQKAKSIDEELFPSDEFDMDTMWSDAPQVHSDVIHTRATMGFNNPPRIVNAPEQFTTEGETFVFTPVAVDLDGDLPITFELVEGPEGMTISETGRVEYHALVSEDENEQAYFSFTVAAIDSRGGRSESNWGISIAEIPPDATFGIISSPITLAEPGMEYVYQPVLENTHSTGDPVTWSLMDGPTDMEIEFFTGRITWTPGIDDDGYVPVILRATQVDGDRTRRSIQEYVIAIREADSYRLGGISNLMGVTVDEANGELVANHMGVVYPDMGEHSIGFSMRQLTPTPGEENFLGLVSYESGETVTRLPLELPADGEDYEISIREHFDGDFQGMAVTTIWTSTPPSPVISVNPEAIEVHVEKSPFRFNTAVSFFLDVSERTEDLVYSIGRDTTDYDLFPSGGTIPSGVTESITLLINVRDMEPGVHQSMLTISSNATTPVVEIPVTITVEEVPDPAIPVLSPPRRFIFVVEGGTIANQVINLSNLGGMEANYTVTTSEGYVQVNPSTGVVVPDQTIPLGITIDTTDLAVGIYESTLTLTTEDPNVSTTAQIVIEVVEELGDEPRMVYPSIILY